MILKKMKGEIGYRFRTKDSPNLDLMSVKEELVNVKHDQHESKPMNSLSSFPPLFYNLSFVTSRHKPSTISEFFSADSTTTPLSLSSTQNIPLSLPDVSNTYRTFYHTLEFIYSIHCSSYWFEPSTRLLLIVLNTHTTFIIPFQSLLSLQHNKPNHLTSNHTQNNTSQTLSRTLPNTKYSLSLFHKFHNTIHHDLQIYNAPSTTLWCSSIPFIVHPIDLNHHHFSFVLPETLLQHPSFTSISPTTNNTTSLYLHNHIPSHISLAQTLHSLLCPRIPRLVHSESGCNVCQKSSVNVKQ